MWAQIETNPTTLEKRIVRTFKSATAFTRDGINYPASIFRAAPKLKSLGILPIRRKQMNAPDDTFGWSSSSTFVILDDEVLEQVTWTEDADADDQRAERDRLAALQALEAKSQRWHRFLISKGYYRDGQALPTDVSEFEATESARVGRN